MLRDAMDGEERRLELFGGIGERLCWTTDGQIRRYPRRSVL